MGLAGKFSVQGRRDFLKRFVRMGVGFVLLFPFSKILGRCHPTSAVAVTRSLFTMGTKVNITAYGESMRHCNHAINLAFGEFNAIDHLMSVFKQDSQLSQLNANAGREAVAVDSRIIEVLETTEQFSQTTDGAFDVTIEPLMQLWGFRNEQQTKPNDRQIAEALEAVGYRNIVINKKENTVGLLNRKSRIDLGGIAVGYSVDRAVHILRSEGIEQALINHSGDIYALGTPPDADAWEIGIVDPQNTDSIITKVALRDQALSTSGSYNNYILYDGIRFGHLLDPKRGIPVDPVLSLTVIADLCITADALSTGCFIAGIEQARHFIHDERNLKLLAVIEQNGREELIQLQGD